MLAVSQVQHVPGAVGRTACSSSTTSGVDAEFKSLPFIWKMWIFNKCYHPLCAMFCSFERKIALVAWQYVVVNETHSSWKLKGTFEKWQNRVMVLCYIFLWLTPWLNTVLQKQIFLPELNDCEWGELCSRKRKEGLLQFPPEHFGDNWGAVEGG